MWRRFVRERAEPDSRAVGWNAAGVQGDHLVLRQDLGEREEREEPAGGEQVFADGLQVLFGEADLRRHQQVVRAELHVQRGVLPGLPQRDGVRDDVRGGAAIVQRKFVHVAVPPWGRLPHRFRGGEDQTQAATPSAVLLLINQRPLQLAWDVDATSDDTNDHRGFLQLRDEHIN